MEVFERFATKKSIELNDEQKQAIAELNSFLCNDGPGQVFVLKGSAGTGKTTLLLELARILNENRLNFQLLAPTGNAAKVVSKKTGIKARTVHSFLYSIVEKKNESSFWIEFIPKENNLFRPLIILVDEASMLSDLPANNDMFVSKSSPLFDLFQFLKASPKGSKIIFIGDHCQLPPVNEQSSGALSAKVINEKYGFAVSGFELKNVVRQQNNSYVLQNALLLRSLIYRNKSIAPPLKYNKLYTEELALQMFCKLYRQETPESVIFIAWKNATVDKLNLAIRNLLYNRPEEIFCQGEQIILARSYFGSAGYIPSGEIGKVSSYSSQTIEKVAESYFADITLEFPSPSGESIVINTKVDLQNFLFVKESNPVEKKSNLWAIRIRKNKKLRETKNPADDPYLSAIKIKYGCAITAHKAQGSEWENVFLYPEAPVDENRLKWIYTSVTRAKQELYSF